MTALIHPLALERADSGSYFVSFYKLVEMDSEDLKTAESVLQELVRQYPEYEFTIWEEIIDQGITIKWRKIK